MWGQQAALGLQTYFSQKVAKGLIHNPFNEGQNNSEALWKNKMITDISMLKEIKV